MRLQHDKLMNICQLSLSMFAWNFCQVVAVVAVAAVVAGVYAALPLFVVVVVIRHVAVVARVAVAVAMVVVVSTYIKNWRHFCPLADALRCL